MQLEFASIAQLDTHVPPQMCLQSSARQESTKIWLARQLASFATLLLTTAETTTLFLEPQCAKPAQPALNAQVYQLYQSNALTENLQLLTPILVEIVIIVRVMFAKMEVL